MDQQDCKQAALKYLKIWTKNLWKLTSTWIDTTKTFDKFKAEVFQLYPGATGNWAYTIQDLNLVIGHYAHTGIWNTTDLGEYHCCFLLISRYLVRKNHLLTQEQSRFFFKGLLTQLKG
jgi:hypothetical protein